MTDQAGNAFFLSPIWELPTLHVQGMMWRAPDKIWHGVRPRLLLMECTFQGSGVFVATSMNALLRKVINSSLSFGLCMANFTRSYLLVGDYVDPSRVFNAPLGDLNAP